MSQPSENLIKKNPQSAGEGTLICNIGLRFSCPQEMTTLFKAHTLGLYESFPFFIDCAKQAPKLWLVSRLCLSLLLATNTSLARGKTTKSLENKITFVEKVHLPRNVTMKTTSLRQLFLCCQMLMWEFFNFSFKMNARKIISWPVSCNTIKNLTRNRFKR